MLYTNFDKTKLENSGRPKIKTNREYLLRKEVAHDFNTYFAFDPFGAFADVFDNEEQVKMAKDKKYNPRVGKYKGVRSIFNKYGSVLLGAGTEDVTVASEWRKSNNVPLIDTPENRKSIRINSGCTIRELVEASSKKALGRALYSYSDFMYCKYLGQVPNNYLITLRRFPTPVDDYISSAGLVGSNRQELSSNNATPIGTLVSWMNTPGNNMEEILQYSVSMPYDEKKAEWESNPNAADSTSKPLNAWAAIFDKTYRDQFQAGQAGNALTGLKPDYVQKLFGGDAGMATPPYADWLGWQDKNKVYGPVDAIKYIYKRGEDGLKFNQEIKLVFEYELRSYNGINSKQAMLDLISNILNVTYSTGDFWPGGYRGNGAHQSNIFTNLNVFKTKGGLPNFMDAFAADVSNITGGVKKTVEKNGGLFHTLKNFFNDLGGMFVGGLLNKLGRPQKQAMAALLSPAPTGLWHLTIGNPFHPIMSLGNMVLTNTTITHSGPLGLDDFPTGLKVECTLTRGKPRDLREIEKMYMNGNDRIYSSMGPYWAEMYKNAKEYKEKEQNNQPTLEEQSEFNSAIKEGADEYKAAGKAVAQSFTSLFNKVVSKSFGTDDHYRIGVSAMEQENGAYDQTKKQQTGQA